MFLQTENDLNKYRKCCHSLGTSVQYMSNKCTKNIQLETKKNNLYQKNVFCHIRKARKKPKQIIRRRHFCKNIVFNQING